MDRTLTQTTDIQPSPDMHENASLPPTRKLRVAVLMGGTSSEREVSLATGKQIVAALDPAKYDVVGLDTQEMLALSGNSSPALPSKEDTTSRKETAALAQHEAGVPQTSPSPQQSTPNTQPFRPDLVFIALHGRGGEDGTIQGMLELLGLPYTGSGVLASALAMDKAKAKAFFRAAHIPVIDDVPVTRQQMREGADLRDTVAVHLGFPVFVKPNAEGSSVGGTLVTEPGQLLSAVEAALRYDSLVLVEKYIRGTEITVGVLGNTGEHLEVLPVVEIIPKSAYYDFESKYAAGGSEHLIPARLSEPLACRAHDLARQCHTLLGCRGQSRTDMIVTDGEIYVLEVNTIPGMTPTSLLPQAAEAAGIPFPALLDRLIASAMAGHGEHGNAHHSPEEP